MSPMNGVLEGAWRHAGYGWGPARGNSAGPWDQPAAAVSEAVWFAHPQEMTATGCDAEHVPENPGQFPGQLS